MARKEHVRWQRRYRLGDWAAVWQESLARAEAERTAKRQRAALCSHRVAAVLWPAAHDWAVQTRAANGRRTRYRFAGRHRESARNARSGTERRAEAAASRPLQCSAAA